MRIRRLVGVIVLAFVVSRANAQAPPLATDAANQRLESLRTVASKLTAAAVNRATEFAGDRYPHDDSPVLIAQGDSWYAYPFFNVLKYLEWKHQYRVESVAHNGEWLEAMAYDPERLSEFTLAFMKIRRLNKEPRAILLSGGGNDIAGDQLTAFLSHRASGKDAVNNEVLEEIVANRLRDDMITLIITATDLSNNYFPGRKIPIIIHGYGYPVPDGRGYIAWGPWLRPSFDRKSYQHTLADLQAATDAMTKLIKRYNEVLATIPQMPGFEHVRFVNITDLLSHDLKNYETDWGNELHPTAKGFAEVAKRFASVIEAK
jgi:lysophospholipase L1-like esterase